MNTSQQTLTMLNDNGYDDLEDYLRCIASWQNLLYNDVCQLAELYGEDQLMDGLIDAIETM